VGLKKEEEYRRVDIRNFTYRTSFKQGGLTKRASRK
jgi:hypothetical protein